MASENENRIGIRIDALTNSIVNTISGDSFPTEVHPLATSDIKLVSPKKGWIFNWSSERKLSTRQVFKLTIRNNPDIIQGLVSISDNDSHYYLHLIESAPFNLGKNKLYEGVPGNLFAFTCRTSWDTGYEGFVAFASKTRLIEHYEKSLGATHIGGNRMVIYPHDALKLIHRYYPELIQKMGHIKEPKGVDFYVDSRPLTAEDLHLISEAIAYYKATGKKMRPSSNRKGTLSKRKGKVIKSSQ